MTLSKLAQDLIEEINGLNILINGERLPSKIEDALERETIEKLTEIKDALKYQEVVGILWDVQD